MAVHENRRDEALLEVEGASAAVGARRDGAVLFSRAESLRSSVWRVVRPGRQRADAERARAFYLAPHGRTMKATREIGNQHETRRMVRLSAGACRESGASGGVKLRGSRTALKSISGP
jgi:hypothetical protein